MVDTRIDAAGVPIVSVSGELDSSNAASLEAAVAPIAAEHPERLVFDLSRLRFMDSAGIAVLVGVAAKVNTVQLREPSRPCGAWSSSPASPASFRSSRDERRQISLPARVGTRRAPIRTRRPARSAARARRSRRADGHRAGHQLRAARPDAASSSRSITVAEADPHRGARYGPGRPVPRSPTPRSEPGEDCCIVEAMSDSWGIDRLARAERPCGSPFLSVRARKAVGRRRGAGVRRASPAPRARPRKPEPSRPRTSRVFSRCCRRPSDNGREVFQG